MKKEYNTTSYVEIWLNTLQESRDYEKRNIQRLFEEKEYYLVYTSVKGLEGRSAVYCTREYIQRLKEVKEVIGVKKMNKPELDAVRVLY